MTNSSSDRSDSCSNFFMLEIDAALRDIKATEDILERPKLETCFPFGNFFGRLEFVFNERASCQVSFSRQGTVRIEIMWICIFRRESGQRRMSISCSMLSPLPFPSLASCTKAKNSLGRFFPLCHIFKSNSESASHLSCGKICPSPYSSSSSVSRLLASTPEMSVFLSTTALLRLCFPTPPVRPVLRRNRRPCLFVSRCPNFLAF